MIGQKALREVKRAVREDLSNEVFQGALEVIGTISDEGKERLRTAMNEYANVQTMIVPRDLITKKAKELKIIC